MPQRSLEALVALLCVVGLACSCASPRSQFPSAPPTAPRMVSAVMLERSVELVRRYLLNSQTERGTFVYRYDFLREQVQPGDHDARQAGALWTLAGMHRRGPSQQTAGAVARGLGFFRDHSVLTDDGRRYIVYPGAARGSTGTVALVALALVELLRADYPLPDQPARQAELAQYIRFLRSMRMQNGHFSATYDLRLGVPTGGVSPFSDGEALLLMVKAAKYAGHPELRDLALRSAEQMYWDYVLEARAAGSSEPIAEAFYQWGTMAFYEIYTAGWQNGAKYARRAVDMACAIVKAESTRPGEATAGPLCEGLAAAWELARLTGRTTQMLQIGTALDERLAEAITRQVGGPAPNDYLKRHPTSDPLAVGGVMSGPADPVLQIDVATHLAHAMMLAREFIYRE